MSLRFISVIIPAYNEETRIGNSVNEVVDYLRETPYEWEVIVVDDGSRDDTSREVQSLVPSIQRLKLVRHQVNRGKGAAVCTGLKAAQGDAILFCDADGATPMTELDRFIPILKDGVDFVIGSRHLSGSQILVTQGRVRRVMGEGYRWLCRALLTLQVTDVTCGFKLLSRHAADLFVSRMKIRRWSFDAEMLTIAQIHHLPFSEIPIQWKDRRGTKVCLMRDTLGSFLDLIRISIHRVRGAYR